MSEVLTVPTHFEDLSQFSDGFVDRVDQDTLILYGPVPYEDGSAIEFAVLLADGYTALEGIGKVRAAVDGGSDRVPETRYDVVIESLDFDGRYEAVFESLVITRQRVSEPPTGTRGEVHEDDVEQADTEGQPTVDEFSDSWDDAEVSSEEPMVADDAAEPVPEGLTRPSLGRDEEVVHESSVQQEPAPSTGLFQYAGTLPIPERPPTPGEARALSEEAVPDDRDSDIPLDSEDLEEQE